MSIAKKYQFDVALLRYTISCLESLNAEYESLLKNCSEIRKQEREIKKLIRDDNPYIIALSALIAQTAEEKLFMHVTKRKPEFSIVMDKSEPGTKEVAEAIPVIVSKAKQIHSEYINL